MYKRQALDIPNSDYERYIRFSYESSYERDPFVGIIAPYKESDMLYRHKEEGTFRRVNELVLNNGININEYINTERKFEIYTTDLTDCGDYWDLDRELSLIFGYHSRIRRD